MSTCISRHGEYGSHVPGDDYACERCGVVDEDAQLAAAEERGYQRAIAALRDGDEESEYWDDLSLAADYLESLAARTEGNAT